MPAKRVILELGTGNDLHGGDYTKAALRAVQDALPFLQQAESVMVVEVSEGDEGEQALHRIKDGLGRAKTEFAWLLSLEEEVWTGDRLTFRAAALGQRASGTIDVYEAGVRLEVTLPWLLHPLLIVLILETMNAFRAFDTIYVLTGGGPGDATRILPMEVYELAFAKYNFGAAATLAIMMFATNVLLVLGYVRLARWKL